MNEIFAKPCVGAIIEKKTEHNTYILVQTRQKEGGGTTNGLLELPAGKIREYEDIFSALRREVREETGLKITKIHGEEDSDTYSTAGVTTRSFTPYCTTQNLSGAYSILLHTFLCEAEGELLTHTDETQDIHWMNADKLRNILETAPETLFFMHINALHKYFKSSLL